MYYQTYLYCCYCNFLVVFVVFCFLWFLVLFRQTLIFCLELLNSSVVVQGKTDKLWPRFRIWTCGWSRFWWKIPAGKGAVDLLSWHGSNFEFVLHFVRCYTVTVSPNQIIILISFTSWHDQRAWKPNTNELESILASSSSSSSSSFIFKTSILPR